MDDRLAHANWDLVPEHIRGGIRRWIENGIPPGSFMTAVICNDLREAMGCADDINRARIHDIVSFFYQDAPSGCWGSPAKFDAWAAAGGLAGKETIAA